MIIVSCMLLMKILVMNNIICVKNNLFYIEKVVDALKKLESLYAWSS
jgi:hypothetical protein